MAAAVPGTIATLKVRVLKHGRRRAAIPAPYKVACEDESGRIDLVFFHAERAFIERQLPVGADALRRGRIERYSDSCRWRIPTTSSRRKRATSCRCWSRSIR